MCILYCKRGVIFIDSIVYTVPSPGISIVFAEEVKKGGETTDREAVVSYSLFKQSQVRILETVKQKIRETA